MFVEPTVISILLHVYKWSISHLCHLHATNGSSGGETMTNADEKEDEGNGTLGEGNRIESEQ